MARLAALAFTSVLLAAGGCQWPFKRPDPAAGSGGVLSSPPPPSLLIGPQAAGHAAPTELPTKDAAVACLVTAQELDKSGNVKEAILLYEKSREQDPSTAAAVGRRLAVMYDLSGDFAKASAEYEPLLAANPDDPNLLNDVGYSYYARGDFARAEEHLTKASKLDPKNKRVWLNLGLAVAAQGRFEDALNHFVRAGSEAEARSNLAFALAAQGRKQDAVAQYRRALELEPGLTQAKVALGRLENPPPAKADGKVTRADHKERPARAEDVPTFQELEERLKREDEAKQAEANARPNSNPPPRE